MQIIVRRWLGGGGEVVGGGGEQSPATTLLYHPRNSFTIFQNQTSFEPRRKRSRGKIIKQ